MLRSHSSNLLFNNAVSSSVLVSNELEMVRWGTSQALLWRDWEKSVRITNLHQGPAKPLIVSGFNVFEHLHTLFIISSIYVRKVHAELLIDGCIIYVIRFFLQLVSRKNGWCERVSPWPPTQCNLSNSSSILWQLFLTNRGEYDGETYWYKSCTLYMYITN